jgi:tyrosyl-tRNA synthetase
MGRTEEDTQYASQIFYPCMQTADIFQLKADICQLGMDQRKVNVLARELGEKLGYWKPVSVSHHMLLGLTVKNTGATGIDRKVELKMSKSDPNSAIFLTDTEEQISKKISKAYCPEKIVEENPIIEYCKYLVFETNKKMKIERPTKFGGNVEYSSITDLEKDYSSGKLHPMDLKNATAKYINKMILPVRKHFEKNNKAKNMLKRLESIA